MPKDKDKYEEEILEEGDDSGQEEEKQEEEIVPKPVVEEPVSDEPTVVIDGVDTRYA